jgi:hypothetical protein
MRPGEPNKNSDDRKSIFSVISKFLEYYVFPAVLAVLGTSMLLYGFLSPIPRESDLHEVCGQLNSFYIRQTGSRGSNNHTVIILQNGWRIWRNTGSKDNEAKIFEDKNSMVCAFIPKNPQPSMDGAIKSYGLKVNDKLIQTVEKDLGDEFFEDRVSLPIIGSLLIAGAVFAVLHSRRKHSKSK